MVNRMREIRRRLGLAAGELARRLGITETQVEAIESGEANPSTEQQMAIVDIFNWLEGGRYDQEDWTAERVFGGARIYGGYGKE